MKHIIFILIPFLLLSTSCYSADINYAEKMSGDHFTAADANEIKSAVNSKTNKSDLIANVLDYGADRTGGTDSTASFRAATATGKQIYVPTGNYLISGCINPNSTDSKIVVGDGMYGHTTGGTTITIDDSALSITDSIFLGMRKLQGFEIIGTSKIAIGIDQKKHIVGFVGPFVLEDLSISGMGIAINLDSCFSSTLRNIKIVSNKTGIYAIPINTIADDGYLADMLFERVTTGSNDEYAIYLAPVSKSPNINFVNCEFGGASTIVPHVVHIGSNCDPISMSAIYMEGAGGTTANILLNGVGNINGFYDNSSKGIDLGPNTSIYSITNLKQVAGSAGIINGSANAKLSLDTSVVNTLPQAKDLTLINTSVAGTYRNVKSNKIIKDLGVAGTAVDVFTLVIDTNSSGQIELPYILRVYDSVMRQVATGVLTVGWVNNNSTTTTGVSATVLKTISGGTLNDPIFSASATGTTITVSVAITSSYTGGSGRLYISEREIGNTTYKLPTLTAL